MIFGVAYINALRIRISKLVEGERSTSLNINQLTQKIGIITSISIYLGNTKSKQKTEALHFGFIVLELLFAGKNNVPNLFR